jgi:hypothetical protein
MAKMKLVMHKCPTCGAAEGGSCRTPKGRKKANMHDTRPFSIVLNPTPLKSGPTTP